jgi:Leucine-rich repeat (LRR) protein
MIFPEAMQGLKNLRFLALDNVKFRYPEQDLLFLKKIENSLTRLSMNNAFPKLNMESTEVLSFFKMEHLDDLSIRQNGLLNLKKIEFFCPNLTVLDLSHNKIFSVDAIETLHKLPNLAEINFIENPICVHKHLKEMILDVIP